MEISPGVTSHSSRDEKESGPFPNHAVSLTHGVRDRSLDVAARHGRNVVRSERRSGQGHEGRRSDRRSRLLSQPSSQK